MSDFLTGNWPCCAIALQTPAQLEEIYGRASSQAIIGNCATRVIFAEHDPEISEKISKSLGGRTKLKNTKKGSPTELMKLEMV